MAVDGPKQSYSKSLTSVLVCATKRPTSALRLRDRVDLGSLLLDPTQSDPPVHGFNPTYTEKYKNSDLNQLTVTANKGLLNSCDNV